jgi:hypothetical protein
MDGDLRAEFDVGDPVEMAAHGNSGTKSLWKSLAKVQALLPMMVELQTFSFYVTSNIICPVGFWIRHCDVLQLLASLPSKVENLELDTKGIEVFKEAEQRLCPQIAARIPNLRSLRLRLGHMCHEVLTGECATTHLREIVINFSPHHSQMELRSALLDSVSRMPNSTAIFGARSWTRCWQ